MVILGKNPKSGSKTPKIKCVFERFRFDGLAKAPPGTRVLSVSIQPFDQKTYMGSRYGAPEIRVGEIGLWEPKVTFWELESILSCRHGARMS
jgi:hypothetical protein